MMLLFLVSCATQPVKAPAPEPAFKVIDLNPNLRSGEYVQKVDNFLVVSDVPFTSTIKQVSKGQIWFRNFLNMTIPSDLKLKMQAERLWSRHREMQHVLVPMATYDKAKFHAAGPEFFQALV